MNPMKNDCLHTDECDDCGYSCRFPLGKDDQGANIFCQYEWQCTLNYPGRYD